MTTSDNKRQTLITTEHYELDIEFNDELAAIHFGRLDKISKTVISTLICNCSDLADFLYEMGFEYLYAAIPENNRVINKLAKRVGFKLVSSTDNNGTPYSVYVYIGV